MFHMSPANPCNLTCSFCCFANRAMKEMLTVEQMKSAIDQFVALGATGMEFTGGGEPTLHPKLDEVIEYAYNKGLKIGICTNGSRLKKIKCTQVSNHQRKYRSIVQCQHWGSRRHWQYNNLTYNFQ